MKLHKTFSILLATLGLATFTLRGQYTVNYFNQPYLELVQAKCVSRDTVFLLNFDITPFGHACRSININDSQIGCSNTKSTSFFPFWPGVELVDRSYGSPDSNTNTKKSSVCVHIEGQTGNRTVKIEYRNFKLKGSELRDSLNFQVWFYEDRSSFEYRYGPINIEREEIVVPWGLRVAFEHYSPPEPTALRLSTFIEADSPQLFFGDRIHDGIPREGDSYRYDFVGANSIAERNNHEDFILFPNPSVGIINIKSNQQFEGYVIRSLGGEILLSNSDQFSEKSINLTQHLSGFYIIQLWQNNKVIFKKFQLIR